MTMPFRQHAMNFDICPCCDKQYKMVKKADGRFQRVEDNVELPPSKKFELQNMLDAKIPLEEVSSYVVAGNFNEPQEPNEGE